MSEPKFPTQSQVEHRADCIIEGLGYPALPALPGLVFRRLTLGEKGQANLAYTSHLRDLMNQGGRFSEPLLLTECRRRCLEVGVNYDDLMEQEEAFLQRIRDMAPVELRDAVPRLSADEIAKLSDEAKKVYLEQLRGANHKAVEYLDGLFTPEEQLIRGVIAQVKQLHSDLKAQTYEHHARVRRRLVEILHGARRADDINQPYFASLEALYELEDTDPNTWIALAQKWAEFKEGKWPGFTPRSSSTPMPGA